MCIYFIIFYFIFKGCDTGFGNELARRMDYLGYKVYACCLDPNGEGARKLSNESSERLTMLPLNVVDEKSVQEVKEFVARDLGKNSSSFFKNLLPYKFFKLLFTKIKFF